MIVETRARARYFRQAPRKISRALDMVRGKNVESALNILHFSPQKASKVIEKTIQSAVSNLLQTEEGKSVNLEDLVIKEAYVDGGPALKRLRPGAMGRVSRIRKRTSHLTIVLAGGKGDG